MESSYIAMYRKWRPRTLGEVRGQDAIVTALKNQIETGRIGHAYLFCGTRGTGKTSVAKILARAVNCEHPKDGEPCNECPTCRSILADASMNVIEIDAASNNGVDNIRDIRDQVQYPPTQGRYKVFIIDEVHMLSTGAFNALLKTLEEPPEYVIFILATTEVHRIPVTVVSRCQRYDFKRISVEVIKDRLRELTEAEEIAIEDRALEYIAKTADGAMRDAISLLDECVSFGNGGFISYSKVLSVLGSADIATHRRLFKSVTGGSVASALAVIEDIVMTGKDLSWYVSDFLWYLRNLLIIRSTDDAERIIDASDDDLRAMKEDASEISTETLMRYIREYASLSNSLRLSNQKRVLLELSTIRLMTPQMQEDMESVLDRVSRLERKMEAGITVRQTVSAPAEEPVFIPDEVYYEDPAFGASSIPDAYSVPGDGGARKTASGDAAPGPAEDLSVSNPDRFVPEFLRETGQYTRPKKEEPQASGRSDEGQPKVSPASPEPKIQKPASSGSTASVQRVSEAEREAFRQLKEEWSSLIRSIGGPNMVVLKGTMPEQGADGTITIVWDNAGTFNMERRNTAIRALTDAARERFGREISFKARLKDAQGSAGGAVTRDEIQRLINMPIENED